MSAFIPSKSSPTVSLSKYLFDDQCGFPSHPVDLTHLYCFTSNPASLEIGTWFPHVGEGR